MNILKKMGEEIVPLSRRQNIVLMVIIACVFQFVLFYAPALADEAVNRQKALAEEQKELMREAEELIITNDSVIKSAIMDSEAAKLMTTTAETLLEQKEATTTTPVVKVIRTSTHVITAYNSEAAQTDDSPCITANGFNVCEHGVEDTIAANFLKFGTKVQIPELFGDRVFVVRDRMNKRYSNRVDVWMLDRHDAIQFGVKTAKINVVVIEEPATLEKEIAKK